MNELADGMYDVLVIGASEPDNDAVVHLEVAITSGAAKGSTVMIAARHLPGDGLDLLGLPSTLIVEEGRPRLSLG